MRRSLKAPLTIFHSYSAPGSLPFHVVHPYRYNYTVRRKDMTSKSMKAQSIGRWKFILRSAGISLGAMAFPGLVRAQSDGIKVGMIHPMTGLVAYSGQHCRLGALM